MKNFDLNLIGVQELGKGTLLETNGGQVVESPSPWWSVASTIIQAAVIVWVAASEAYIQASKEGVYEGMPSPSFRH